MQEALYSDPDLPGKLLPDKSRSDRIILDEGNCWYFHGYILTCQEKIQDRQWNTTFEAWKEEDCYMGTHIMCDIGKSVDYKEDLFYLI